MSDLREPCIACEKYAKDNPETSFDTWHHPLEPCPYRKISDIDKLHKIQDALNAMYCQNIDAVKPD